MINRHRKPFLVLRAGREGLRSAEVGNLARPAAQQVRCGWVLGNLAEVRSLWVRVLGTGFKPQGRKAQVLRCSRSLFQEQY